MEFIRNFLIIGEEGGFQSELKESMIKISPKVSVEIISDKNILSQKLLDKKIHSIFLNMNQLTDCQYILRLLTMYKKKTNPKLSRFFTSNNFEVFQKIVTDPALGDVNMLPWPPSPNDLSHKIIASIFDKKLTKQIVTKDENVLNVDLEFMKIFIDSTKSVLKEMGQVKDFAHGKPTFQENLDTPIEPGISSKIMISSKFFTGNFYVSFPKESFLKLYSCAVFEECEEINNENRDFAGELANIIYGHSKEILSVSGLNLEMVIPSIHDSSTIEAEVVIVIPFESSIGKFYIAIAPGKI